MAALIGIASSECTSRHALATKWRLPRYKRYWKWKPPSAPPSPKIGPRFQLELGEVTMRSMAGQSVWPSWFEQTTLRNLYPIKSSHDNAEVIAGLIAKARSGLSSIQGKLGNLAFLSPPLATERTSASVVAKVLEATTTGLSPAPDGSDEAPGTVVVVAPVGNQLRPASPADFPTLQTAGARHLYSRILVFGDLPASAAISWMQGADRLIQAMQAVQSNGRFGSVETWKRKAALIGLSIGGLESLTAAERVGRHYPNAIGPVVAIAAPIAPAIGGSMDVAALSRDWIESHRKFAGLQATAAVASIKRTNVQSELRKMNTNLATLKSKHLDVATYSSIFSKDLDDIDETVPWYAETARTLYQAKKLLNDGAVFVPKKKESYVTIIRHYENHERATRAPDAIEQALEALPPN